MACQQPLVYTQYCYAETPALAIQTQIFSVSCSLSWFKYLTDNQNSSRMNHPSTMKPCEKRYQSHKLSAVISTHSAAQQPINQDVLALRDPSGGEI